MYAFNLAEYAKWREISSPAYRFWTRAWVGGVRDVAKYDKFLWSGLWVTPAVVRPICPC